MTSFADSRSPRASGAAPREAATLRVLFRAPAGARRGFGHLVRCLSLARALGVRPLVALRGDQAASDVALSLGADLVASPSLRAVRALAPDLVVVDDPVASQARRWIRAARAAGALVVTIHDLGIGAPEGDIVIDGSATRNATGRKGRLTLAGARFALLDPRITQHRDAGAGIRDAKSRRAGSPTPDPRSPLSRRVVIALGGGPHAQTAEAIARAIVAADPAADVRIVAGFVAGARRRSRPRVRWTTSRDGLAPVLADADVAVVGGGMSLYEACAMGVPTVALPVVPAQASTVRAFAARGAAVAPAPRSDARGAAEAALDLLGNPRQRAALAHRSARLVDGRGAWRAAAAVVQHAQRGQL